MLKEIELLIPMLEQITNGALFGFIAYLTANVLVSFMWPLVFVLVATKAASVFLQTQKAIPFLHDKITQDGEKITILASNKKLFELHKEISNKSNYVHDSNIDLALRKIRES